MDIRDTYSHSTRERQMSVTDPCTRTSPAQRPPLTRQSRCVLSSLFPAAPLRMLKHHFTAIHARGSETGSVPVEAFCETFLDFCPSRTDKRWTTRAVGTVRRLKSSPQAPRPENSVLRAAVRRKLGGVALCGQQIDEKQDSATQIYRDTSIHISLHSRIA